MASPASAMSVPRRWAWGLLSAAGLLGAGGVTLAAAGAHIGGGESVRSAGDIMLIHAAAIIGLAALAKGEGRGSRLILVPATMFAVGAAVFGSALAFAGLGDWRPVPQAAPAGGMCLIAGWIFLLALAAAKAGGKAERG